jgi:molecular chaperone DnaK
MQVISKAIGIDLGTTNSAVALMDPTDSELVIHSDPNMKRETTPSCVWKNPKTGEIVVGHHAFRRIGTAPPPVRSIKREMGKQLKARLTDEDLLPEQVSAYILGEMRRQIESDVKRFETEATRWFVKRAVITVPAYFDQPEVDATRRAGELAGLEVLDLLHEPTAAACYHCWKSGTQNGLFLVYDFGGGTFDVSVLRSNAGKFEVLGISGNTKLGGDDLDTSIAEYLQERLLREGYALELKVKDDREDALRFDRLRLLAEGVKKALSTTGEFFLKDSGSLKDRNGDAVIIETMFERPEIEALMLPHIERTIPYCWDALEKAQQKAGVTIADVDAVILAGGSTHISLVRDLVRKSFCQDPAAAEPRAKCTEPVYEKVDTVVALGAAIRAAAMGGLEIYNAERNVRVAFRGTGTTGSRQASVGGKVEAVGGGIDVSGGRVRLLIEESGFEDEQELTESGMFGFRDVPLQPSADNLLTFEVYDAQGEPIATAGRPVRQSRDPVPPTGGAASTAVLSKAILLEVERRGTITRKVLAPALQTLAFEKTFSFLHPGNTDLVRLPLYQQTRKIQEVQVPVPSSLPKGAPVELSVYIDGLLVITARGKIGDVGFEAAVAIPPDRPLPTETEASALEQRFREELNYVSSGKKMPLQGRYRKARERFEAARERGETTQAVHEFEEMEEIVGAISRVDGQLQPPKQFFDELVKECFEFNQGTAQEHATQNTDYHYDELQKDIEAQRQFGENAFREGDQTAYSDAILNLESIKSHIVTLFQKVAKIVDNRTPEQRAADNLQFAIREAAKLEQLAGTSQRDDLQKETRDIGRQLHDLTPDDIQRNPGAVQEKVEALRRRLEEIKNTIMGKKSDVKKGALVQDAEV